MMRPTTAGRRRLDPSSQAWIGALLAVGIIGVWVALHIGGVFFFRWSWRSAPFAALIIAAETWLGAGMFIVAHDAMHDSLFPGRPRWNAAFGQLALGLYAGFSFRKLNAKHHQHHHAPGTDQDPDFHPERPTAFLSWYLRFFRTYFGWVELGRLALMLFVYLMLFRASPLNAAVFWGLPAILSSIQLFTFGTWLPHRHDGEGFTDEHRARTQDYPWLLSLLTCFHFGLHHEHHVAPTEPWWRLPGARRRSAKGAIT